MRRSLIALALVATVLPGTARAASCVQDLPTIGTACRVPGGYVLHLDDGTTVLTHGGDPAPSPAVLTHTPSPSPVACATDRAIQPHGLAIYALPSDQADRSATMAPDIRAQIETANGKLRAEAAEFATDVRYVMACDAGQIRLETVRLSTTRAATTFESIVSDVKLAGHSWTNAKYWIWLEGTRGLGGFGGFGSIENSSVKAANNANNFGPSYAVTFGYENAAGGWFIQMHENGHNLGAVQNTAFMSSGAFHCNDGQDVMCYADGGPRSSYDPSVCAVQHFDCRHDDYFNPRPEPFSYLDRSWNLGWPLNRFVSGCAYRAGRIVVMASQTIDVSGCAGRPFALSGFPPARPASAGPVTLTGERSVLLDVDVCFTGASGTISCSRTPIQGETGTVPEGATSAVVSAGATAAIADYVFSVI